MPIHSFSCYLSINTACLTSVYHSARYEWGGDKRWKRQICLLIHALTHLCWGPGLVFHITLYFHGFILYQSVQFSHSVVSDSLRPHEPQDARPPCPSSTPRVHPNSCPLSVMPSNHLIHCHPLFLPPSIFPSIGVFSNESVICIRWPNY